MSTLLLLTNALQASTEVLPSLALLPHQIRILPAEVSALVDAPDADAVLLDARRDLVAVRSASRLIRTTGTECAAYDTLCVGRAGSLVRR